MHQPASLWKSHIRSFRYVLPCLYSLESTSWTSSWDSVSLTFTSFCTWQLFIFIVTTFSCYASFSVPLKAKNLPVSHILPTRDFFPIHRTNVTDWGHFPDYLLISCHSHCVACHCIFLDFFLHFFFRTPPRWSTNGTQLNFAAGSEVSQTIRPQHCLTSRSFKCRTNLSHSILLAVAPVSNSVLPCKSFASL